MCTNCNKTEGKVAEHKYSNGKCTICGSKDPDYSSQVMVWIPTNGGTKYHSKPTCSNMKEPIQVTKDEAIKRGFEPCKRCH
jgi:methylphosphotriester-DNA--protein-cysteine methyltransferase